MHTLGIHDGVVGEHVVVARATAAAAHERVELCLQLAGVLTMRTGVRARAAQRMQLREEVGILARIIRGVTHAAHYAAAQRLRRCHHHYADTSSGERARERARSDSRKCMCSTQTRARIAAQHGRMHTRACTRAHYRQTHVRVRVHAHT